MKFLDEGFQKLDPNRTCTQTDGRTDTTERITTPHWRVVIIDSWPELTVIVTSSRLLYDERRTLHLNTRPLVAVCHSPARLTHFTAVVDCDFSPPCKLGCDFWPKLGESTDKIDQKLKM